MACSDAGSAHHDGLLRRASVQRGPELGSQLHRGLEAAFMQVLRVRTTDCSRHMAVHAVHEVVFAAEAIRGPRIHQQLALREPRLHL